MPKGWSIPAHVEAILEHLDALNKGEIDRLAIHMPPRHGKSETVTVRLPLYRLLADPGANVLVTGYNERFARKFGRKTRNMADELGIVASDKSAADEWATVGGGLYMSRGVGSPPTGTGFGMIVIDDPIRRREDASSETYREKAWDWYSEDVYTRIEPGGAIVLVATLWHEDDVCARAVAAEPGRWTVLKLPAISDDGHALWSERFDLAALERTRSVMGAHSFEALYQQNPTPREGSLFQVSKLRVIDRPAVPAGKKVVHAWDLAASEADGDYTARCRLFEHEPGRFAAEFVQFRHEPAERNRRIRQDADLYSGVVNRFPQDPGAAGKESAASIVRLLVGHNVKTLPVTGDKVTRAEPSAAQVNAGNVDIVRNEFAEAAIEQLRQFPSGKHDDIVDAFSDAMSELARRAQKVSVEIT